MSYICVECGAEFEYDEIIKHNMKCTKCKKRRSNIWIKRRPLGSKNMLAR